MPSGPTIRSGSSAIGAADREAILRNHPLFCDLPSPVLERISAYMKRRSAPKDSVIFEKGDDGFGLVGVVSGTVRISVASADGRDMVLNIIRPGEIFGEIALLDGRKSRRPFRARPGLVCPLARATNISPH